LVARAGAVIDQNSSSPAGGRGVAGRAADVLLVLRDASSLRGPMTGVTSALRRL
jgi:hypothetical protein